LNEKQYLAYTTNVERIKKILPNRTSKEDWLPHIFLYMWNSEILLHGFQSPEHDICLGSPFSPCVISSSLQDSQVLPISCTNL
jgi:hypothetical protein